MKNSILRRIAFSVACCTALFSVTAFGQIVEAGSDCVPPCRSGFTCIENKCVEKCNPPCPSGQQCDDEGNCVAKRVVISRSSSGLSEDDTIPTKARRNKSLMVEVPWNGLVGLGVLYTYRLNPQLAIEGGAGLSSMGLKYGARIRHSFSDRNVSPFIGFGFMQGSGTGDTTAYVEDKDKSTRIEYALDPISFLQLTGGLDIVTRNGFTALIGIGWAKALNEGVKDVEITGDLTNTEFIDTFDSIVDLLYKGGLTLSVGIGFSF